MMFACYYDSPLGKLLLTADALGLTGLYFDGEKTEPGRLPFVHTERETPLLAETKRWLDVYFSGREPDFLPPLHPAGSAFRQAVWALLLQIPYGQTTTYGAIARQLAAKQGIPLIEGNIHSSDVFYRQPSDAKPTYWEKLRDERGCLCVEMESFALFANAQVLGKNAACLLTISDSFVSPEITTAEQRQKSFTDMMKVALGAEY